MTPRNTKRSYSKTGLYRAKKALMRFGTRAIDGRTRLGKAQGQWVRDLVADLGGAAAISTQQTVIVDLCARTKLLLDSIDIWLLQQKTLVNHRKRALIPVVRERQQIADSLARYLGTLGLEKKSEGTTSLPHFLSSYDEEVDVQDSTLSPSPDQENTTVE